jgi:small redox-active disulfide protein 2
MKIEILGTGCAKCHQLEQVTKDVVKELAIDATVEEVKDIKKIMNYHILTTPGLAINGELACSGKVPSRAEVTQFIINGLEKEERNRKK